MEGGHGGGTWKVDMECGQEGGHGGWTWRVDMEDGHGEWTWRADMEVDTQVDTKVPWLPPLCGLSSEAPCFVPTADYVSARGGI